MPRTASGSLNSLLDTLSHSVQSANHIGRVTWNFAKLVILMFQDKISRPVWFDVSRRVDHEYIRLQSFGAILGELFTKQIH